MPFEKPNIPQIPLSKDFRTRCINILPMDINETVSDYELICSLLAKIKELTALVNKNDSTVNNLLSEFDNLIDYVNNYFSGLDVTTEIENEFNRLVENGTFSKLITPIVLKNLPALVVDSTTDMTDINRLYILKSNSHIYQWNGTTFVDTGIAYGETIGNVITYGGIIPTGLNYNDMTPNVIYSDTGAQNTTNRPTTGRTYYTWTLSTNIASGQFAIDYNDGSYWYRNMLNGAWSEWANIGGPNVIKMGGVLGANTDYNTLTPNTIFIDANAPGITNRPNSLNTFYVLTIGSGVTLTQYAITYESGETYFRTRNTVGNWSAWVNAHKSGVLAWGGTLPNGANYDTLQTLNIFADTLETTINKPYPGTFYTYKLGTGPAYGQYAFDYLTGDYVYRRQKVDGSFGSWVTHSQGGNPHATALVFGNSILFGSVWINDAYNHLSDYYNAPYGCICHAMGIPKPNVKQTLLSNTGLLVDGGNGNFLNKIINSDLTKIDCVVTQLYQQDMRQFPVGDLSSAPSAVTIVGGIKTILNYIKASSPQTQFVLVSVPPVDSTISGENVFSGKYPNGSSLSELDNIVKTLAEQEHFVYCTWEGLELSYTYHTYTDNNNGHANNENTYRIMGAHVGAQAAHKIKF